MQGSCVPYTEENQSLGNSDDRMESPEGPIQARLGPQPECSLFSSKEQWEEQRHPLCLDGELAYTGRNWNMT
jgi:hypothetical protein